MQIVLNRQENRRVAFRPLPLHGECAPLSIVDIYCAGLFDIRAIRPLTNALWHSLATSLNHPRAEAA
jgi:hypothetical protein